MKHNFDVTHPEFSEELAVSLRGIAEALEDGSIRPLKAMFKSSIEADLELTMQFEALRDGINFKSEYISEVDKEKYKDFEFMKEKQI